MNLTFETSGKSGNNSLIQTFNKENLIRFLQRNSYKNKTLLDYLQDKHLGNLDLENGFNDKVIFGLSQSFFRDRIKEEIDSIGANYEPLMYYDETVIKVVKQEVTKWIDENLNKNIPEKICHGLFLTFAEGLLQYERLDVLVPNLFESFKKPIVDFLEDNSLRTVGTVLGKEDTRLYPFVQITIIIEYRGQKFAYNKRFIVDLSKLPNPNPEDKSMERPIEYLNNFFQININVLN